MLLTLTRMSFSVKGKNTSEIISKDARKSLLLHIFTNGCLLLSMESAGGNELLAFILPIVRIIISIACKENLDLE